MSDYRVEIKVKNNRLLSRITEMGYKDITDFCETNDIPIQYMYNLINLRQSIYNSKNEIYPRVLQIADYLYCSIDDLFSDTQKTASVKSNKTVVNVSENEIQYFIENAPKNFSPENEIYSQELKKIMSESLSRLVPREEKVLKLRFGIGCDAHTLEETGNIINTSRERVRQIEARALRKLRHPKRSTSLEEFLHPVQ